MAAGSPDNADSGSRAEDAGKGRSSAADGPDGSGGRAGESGGSGSKKAEKAVPPAAKRKKKTAGRTTAPKDPGGVSGGGRYTAPIPAEQKGPSPVWVPFLMFALWGLGLGIIILNYMGSLPGSGDGGNGLYLVGGLVLILGGIITATQYR